MTYDKLAFVSHLGNKIKRANQELHALSRENIMWASRKLIISLTKYQFTYCLLVLVFCSRTSMNKSNSIHEKCLRLITNECLNLKQTIGITKYLHGLSLGLMTDSCILWKKF